MMTHGLLKVMYERMKLRINEVVERGSIHGYVTDEEVRGTFAVWHNTPGFTPKNHPTIIQVHS